MAKNSGADGSMTGGSAPIKGPYYPKGGAKGGTMGKPNAPFTPAKSDTITKRSSGNYGNAPRVGKYTPTDSSGKGTVDRQSVWGARPGALGPDGSGSGTTHESYSKPDSDRKPKRGNYDNWPKADTTAYGSKNTGKLK